MGRAGGGGIPISPSYLLNSLIAKDEARVSWKSREVRPFAAVEVAHI